MKGSATNCRSLASTTCWQVNEGTAEKSKWKGESPNAIPIAHSPSPPSKHVECISLYDTRMNRMLPITNIAARIRRMLRNRNRYLILCRVNQHLADHVPCMWVGGKSENDWDRRFLPPSFRIQQTLLFRGTERNKRATCQTLIIPNTHRRIAARNPFRRKVMPIKLSEVLVRRPQSCNLLRRVSSVFDSWKNKR